MRKEWLHDITSLGGNPVYIAILVIALHFDTNLSIQLIAGIFLSYICVVPFRILFYHNRPDKRKYSNWLEKIDASSFPSQHAVRGTTLWLLVGNFLGTPLAWLAAIIAIICVAATRVALKYHHRSDVIGGIILGIAAFAIILYINPLLIQLPSQLGIL